MSQIPDFASERWYLHPEDHRCPHDAWLESCEIAELAQGERSQIRSTVITLRLLGAYHDGHIVLRYTGVESFALSADDASRGLRDWLTDTYTALESGLVRHEIHWSAGSTWRIDARDIKYDWLPKRI